MAAAETRQLMARSPGRRRRGTARVTAVAVAASELGGAAAATVERQGRTAEKVRPTTRRPGAATKPVAPTGRRRERDGDRRGSRWRGRSPGW